MLVAIEGADGCGKSSVADAVARTLGGRVISFPNDAAYTGPIIRRYLRKEWAVGVRSDPAVTGKLIDKSCDDALHYSALAFQALNVMNRMELMPEIREAQIYGRSLVFARYWQSAWVYGQLDGLPAELLERVHATMVQPTVNILLDAPAEVCMERRATRDGALPPERYEGKLDFTRRVVELYRQLWAQEHSPGAWFGGRWVVVDATLPMAGVIEASIAAVRSSRGR